MKRSFYFSGLWWALLQHVLVVLMLVVVCWCFETPIYIRLFMIGCALLLMWKLRWVLRFHRAVRCFKTIANDRIVLHVSPVRECTWSLEHFITRGEAELDKLNEIFGTSIAGPITVERGLYVDDVATPLVYATGYKLSSLLKSKFFFKEQHRRHCYLLAGSFTTFLISRYGWKTYRRFYRNSDSVFTRSQFKRYFGLSFEQAEKQWRRKIVFNEEE